MIRRILVALVLVTVALAGCERVREDGARKFTVGFDADFPPYGFKDGAEYKGFDLDLAREICARKGWTFVPNPINWDAKDMELESGSIDCIWNGFTMQGREDAYTWTKPYVGNSQVVLVKDGSLIRSLADLRGKIVGVQTDTPVQKALSKGGERFELGSTFKELVVMPNYNQAVNELVMGGVDAVALDSGVAKKKMSDLPGRFTMLDEVVMMETYGVGFKKGNTALRDEIQAALDDLYEDGTAAKLAVKYGIAEGSLQGGETQSIFWQTIADLLRGLVITVQIFFLTLLLALPLGVPFALGRMSSNPVVSGVFRLFISVVRGTPLMLQIIFVYFAPYILFGMPLQKYPRLLATVLAFGLNYAAYFAEIYRGGILSIDRGQSEAATALGFTRRQTFLRIILPQTVKRVIPAVGNEVITLVKDTSLAFTIAVTEMFTIAKQLSSSNTSMMPLVAAGVFYYVFNFIVAFAMERLEKRYSYYN